MLVIWNYITYNLPSSFIHVYIFYTAFMKVAWIIGCKGKGKAQKVQEVRVPRFRDNGTGWW